ncbi:MAG: hypothetical protein UT63_C0001G0033 [Candidatus Gottesmanbacteria bacterium GW2011_GWC2_39_8]|uniref:histidine kinase n=1 Tax=Candidatus Gottesmanbacteria bacterium GW2011_GWC2_39_8 TaxID=1618450 RepID=A0A0G0QAV4_9BACT|nr:MAG: hypothetical protein UT63_C0001G0033 [Candidatus Gottesmanbacteria bacterium GW2011_GWC2_39_8]
MLKKIISPYIPYLFILLFTLSVIIGFAKISYDHAYKDMTGLILRERRSTSFLAAKILEDRFDRIIDIVVSEADCDEVEESISKGNWKEAIKLYENLPKKFPFIERVFLNTPEGTATAVFPYIPGIVGNNYSYRDWYKGVSRTWQPYVSDIFKSTGVPEINTVSINVPIWSKEKKVIGIMGIQIKLDTLLAWSKIVSKDPSLLVFFVDKTGNVTGHPSYPPQGDIRNLSHLLAVQNVLKGETGEKILFDPQLKKDVLSTYYPVDPYGWGVVILERVDLVFENRDHYLNNLVLLWALIAFGVVLIIIIILKTKSVYSRLKEKEKILLESIGDGVFVLDKNFKIILWNKAAADITGLKSDEVIGKKYSGVLKFINAKSGNDTTHVIEDAVKKGEIKHLDLNTIMILPDGRKIPVGDSAAPIFSKNKVEGAIVVFHDMTQEHELNAAKDEFIGIAAHQLRTPLGVIRWNIETLLDNKFGQKTKETRKSLEDVYKNNLNLISLVNDLLDVSRINRGKVGSKPEPIDILALVKEIIEERKKDIQTRKIIVEVPTDTKIPKIHTDPNLISQVLRNLFSNALKYNKINGKISIDFKKRDKTLFITIKDSGIGIPKKDQDKVFEKFSRAGNAVKLGIGGTGLGLFVVKSYLEILRGSIRLESEEDKGTSFYLELPYEEHSHY